MAKRVARRPKGAKKVVARKAPAKKVARGQAPARRAAEAAEPARRAARGGVVHWELQSVDSERQQAFYAQLFGWKIDANNAGSYPMVAPAGPGSISAGFTNAAPGAPPTLTVYVSVPDVAAALAKAVELGAQTTLPRTVLDLAIIGQFRDPEGHLIGLIEG